MSYFRIKIHRFGPEETTTAKYFSIDDTDRKISSVIHDSLEPEENFETRDIYCIQDGLILDINKKLSDLDISENSVLVLLVKSKSISPKSSAESCVMPRIPSETDISCLSQIENQKKFARFISDSAWLQNAIIKCPDIGNDMLVFSLIQDPNMLIALLMDNQSLTNALMAHPSLASVVNQLTPVIKSYRNSNAYPPEIRYFLSRLAPNVQHTTQEEGESSGNSSNLEHDSDPVTVQQNTASTLSHHRRGQRQIGTIHTQDIFTPYVGHAYASPSESNVVQEPASNHGRRITATALSQAIAAARYDVPTSSSEEIPSTVPEIPNAPPPNRWAEQLSQLAEMGITDEIAAQNALDATNGDLNLAIQILFGGEL